MNRSPLRTPDKQPYRITFRVVIPLTPDELRSLREKARGLAPGVCRIESRPVSRSRSAK